MNETSPVVVTGDMVVNEMYRYLSHQGRQIINKYTNMLGGGTWVGKAG